MARSVLRNAAGPAARYAGVRPDQVLLGGRAMTASRVGSLLIPLSALACGYVPDKARVPEGLEKVEVASASSSILLDRGLCVLASDGQVQCVSTYHEDARSSDEPGLKGARALVEGGSCGLFGDGSLKCSEDNGVAVVWATGVVQAQLENRYLCYVDGEGAATCRRSYGDVWKLPLDQAAKQVTVSEQQVCVLLADSQVECFSRESKESLGRVSGLSQPTQIALTGRQTGTRPGLIWGCALVEGAQVKCWNSSFAADLTITWHDRPGEPVTDVIRIAAAGVRGCAITRDRKVHCWGNFVLNLGNDASDGAWTIPDVTDAVALTLGPREASHIDCALSSKGQLTCWGGAHQVGPSFNFFPIPQK